MSGLGRAMGDLLQIGAGQGFRGSWGSPGKNAMKLPSAQARSRPVWDRLGQLLATPG